MPTTRSETFTSSANTQNQTNTVFTVDPGKGFTVEAIGIAIETGAGSDVQVQVYDGDNAVFPTDTEYDVAGQLEPFPAEAELSPGDELVARHDNDSSTARDVTVVVVGERHD